MSAALDAIAAGAARDNGDRSEWGRSSYGKRSYGDLKQVYPAGSGAQLIKKQSKRASFIIAGTNPTPRAEFMRMLETVDQANERGPSEIQRYMAATRVIYESFGVQVMVTLLILTAFGIEVWDTETFPADGSTERKIIDTMDLVLTWVFVGELCINFLSNAFWPFFENPWNWFDLAVVSLSVIHLFIPQVPWLGALRLVRTFRVLRVFGRFQGFRRIIAALGSALIPVIDAFVIVLVVMSVFSILGVSLFRSKAPEYFGSFSNSFFTMFTITTVDGWTEVVNVAAPHVHDWGKLFFISYIVVLVWTLLPVVIAVLLDKFTETMAKDREVLRRARLAVEAVASMTASALDPMLRTLTDFETDEDLAERIRLLYRTLDLDGHGSLTYESVVAALDSLVMGRDVAVSEASWEELTQNGRLCDDRGGLSLAGFEEMVRGELRNYLQRDLAGELRMCEDNSFSIPILSGLKLLLLRRNESGPDAVRELAGSRSRRASVAAISHYVDKVDQLSRQLQSAGRGRRADGTVLDQAEELSAQLRARIDPERIQSARSGRGTVLPGQMPHERDALSVVANGVGGAGGAGSLDMQAIRRVEEMLDNVLRGQERLEIEMAKLRRGQADIQQAVSSIHQSQGPGPGEGGGCDVCGYVDTSRAGPTFRVGRANLCQMCASLVAIGPGPGQGPAPQLAHGPGPANSPYGGPGY